MKTFFLYIAFPFFGWAGEGATPPNLLREQARIQTPVVFREIAPLSRDTFPLEVVQVELDASKADLEVKMFEDVDTGRSLLQARINMKGINQSVLPLDRYGRLTKEALALSQRPFMTFHFPNGKKRQLGVSCTPEFCESTDTRFPFTAGAEMKMSMETNIRGLNGKNWFFFINQFGPDAGSARGSVTPKPLGGIFHGLHFLSQWIPMGGLETNKIITSGEFTFDPDVQSPFVKVLKRCRFETTEGEVQVSASRGFGMESLNLGLGNRAFLQAGDFVGFKNLKSTKSRLRVYELN